MATWTIDFSGYADGELNAVNSNWVQYSSGGVTSIVTSGIVASNFDWFQSGYDYRNGTPPAYGSSDFIFGCEVDWRTTSGGDVHVLCCVPSGGTGGGTNWMSVQYQQDGTVTHWYGGGGTIHSGRHSVTGAGTHTFFARFNITGNIVKFYADGTQQGADVSFSSWVNTSGTQVGFQVGNNLGTGLRKLYWGPTADGFPTSGGGATAARQPSRRPAPLTYR